LRLAARGERHPEPEVSLKAYHWASDRLEVAPLRRELFSVLGTGLVVYAVVIAVLVGLYSQNVGPLLALALFTLAGMCGWTFYMHRLVEKVALVNSPS
jgi:hypothetical protein